MQSGESKGGLSDACKTHPKTRFQNTNTYFLWANVISEGKKWSQYTDMYFCVDTHWNWLINKQHWAKMKKKKRVRNQQLFGHVYDCYFQQNNFILAIHLHSYMIWCTTIYDIRYDIICDMIRYYSIYDTWYTTIYDMMWHDFYAVQFGTVYD